jgi:hypothetical protein
VQRYTRKMREDKEWHIAEGMRNAPAWFGINYSNYREKTSPNDLWRCLVAITSCTTLCFVCISLFISGRNDSKITRVFETEDISCKIIERHCNKLKNGRKYFFDSFLKGSKYKIFVFEFFYTINMGR